MAKIRFRDLSKKSRIYRVLNLSINLSIIAFLTFLVIYYILTNNTTNRQYASLGVIGFSLIPLIFELIVRERIPNTMYLFINIYIIFAGVLGSALSFYTTYSWYDLIIHSFMGYFAGAIGLFFLCILKDQPKMRIISVALFCLSFSLLIEGVWELFEFGVDLIAPSMEMQGVNFPGQSFPLVTDTMVDIFCNFCGAILFFVHYILAKTTHKNLGIDAMIKEFSNNKQTKKEQELL